MRHKLFALPNWHSSALHNFVVFQGTNTKDKQLVATLSRIFDQRAKKKIQATNKKITMIFVQGADENKTITMIFVQVTKEQMIRN